MCYWQSSIQVRGRVKKFSGICHKIFISQLITLIFLCKPLYCPYTFAIHASTCKFLPCRNQGTVSDTMKLLVAGNWGNHKDMFELVELCAF